MIKRILSFILCVVMVFSVFSICGVTVSAAYNVKQLFTVQSEAVKDGKISYTVNVTAQQKNIGGISIFVEYDSNVLAVGKAGPATTTSTSTGEAQNFKGSYVQGNKENDPNVYTVAYINQTAVSTGSVAKAFFEIEFNVIDSERPLTDVKFYCKEYYSVTEAEKNITVNDGPQLIADYTNTKTLEVPTVSSVVPYADGLKVTWAPVEGALAYKVYRISSSDTNGWTALDGEVMATQALEYYDTGLVSGKNYTYAVSAINYYETGYNTKGKSCIYIAKPIITSCKNIVGGVEIKWDETDGAAFYNVMRREYGQQSWNKIITVNKRDDGHYTYVDKKATEGVKYEYDVISATDTFQSISAETGTENIYISAPQIIDGENTLEGIKLSWNEVLNANRYTVYRWENGVSTGLLPFDAISETTYVDETVETGKTYAYSIQAHTDYGDSGYSSTGRSIVRVPSTEVASLTLERYSVKVEWKPVDGVNGYSVYRKEENTSNWVKVGSVNSNTFVYSDTTASSGMYYNYAVCPVMRSSEGPKISSDAIFYISAPGSVIAENVKQGIKITWGEVGGAQSYEVMRRDVYGDFKVIGTVSKDEERTFLDTNDIQTDKTYVYAVRAINPNSNSLDSENSNELIRILAIGKTTPSLYKGGVKVVWDKAINAEKYAVYRTTGATWDFLGTVASNQYLDTSVSSGKSYSYAVAAIRGDSRGVINTDSPKVIDYIAPPKNVKVTGGSGSLIISWSSVNGAKGYEVYRAIVGSNNYTLVAKPGDDKFSCTDKDIIQGKAYKYVVYAKGKTLTSLQSEEVIAEYLATPVISKISNEYKGVTFCWNKVKGAKEYLVYSKIGDSKWTVIDIVGSDVSSFTDDMAVNGSKMYYAVKARSQYGLSSYKSKSITYLTAPALTISNTKTGVKLTWKDNKKADIFHIYRKSGSQTGWSRIGSTGKTTYEDKTAKAGVTYTYTIRCENEPNASGYNRNGWKYRFLKTPVQSSISNTYGAVVVRWNKIAGATGYIVYRKVDGARNWTNLGKVKTTSYKDTKVKNRSNYTYAIRAYYGNSVSSFNTGKIMKYLQAPVLKVSNALSGVQLKWDRVSGASSYYIYRKAGSAKYWSKIATVTRNSYTDMDVKTGVKYTYTIKAYGSKTLSGYYSKGWAYVFLKAPKISSISSKSNGVNLKWNKIAGADSYMVYRKLNDGSWQYVGKTASGSKVSMIDKKAKKGYTYTYTVRACRGNCKSAFYSNTKCKVRY